VLDEDVRDDQHNSGKHLKDCLLKPVLHLFSTSVVELTNGQTTEIQTLSVGRTLQYLCGVSSNFRLVLVDAVQQGGTQHASRTPALQQRMR